MSKYCPKCGEELIDSAKFCKNCGEDLKGMSNPNKMNSFEIPVVEKDYTIAIIIGYVLSIWMPLLGLIVSIYLLTRNSSKANKHGRYILIITVIVLFLLFLSIFR